MNNTILKCKNCGAILVVPTRDLWKIVKCTACESKELESFELGEKEDGKHTK